MNSTNVTVDSCCEPNCQGFDCSLVTGYIQNCENDLSNIVSTENCCFPTCAVFDCGAGYNNINPNSVIFV